MVCALLFRAHSSSSEDSLDQRRSRMEPGDQRESRMKLRTPICSSATCDRDWGTDANEFLLLPVKATHGKQAGNEARWLFPRLLSFILPCPITDIRIIMLRDGSVFSQCLEAAFLSAHKHLWEWVNHRVWNALPESIITASVPNYQPLTTGHKQRNDTLKLMAAIKYQTGANLYQVGWWSFNVSLFDDLDNPRLNTSSEDGQWGVLKVHVGWGENSIIQVLPTSIFIIASFEIPTILKRTALPFAS